MGTFLVLDIPKVPSDSTIWELRKSVFGIFGIKNLSRLDSRDMCPFNEGTLNWLKITEHSVECSSEQEMFGRSLSQNAVNIIFSLKNCTH